MQSIGCRVFYRSGRCKNKVVGNDCDVGTRIRKYHVLSGSVLLVWGEVEKVLADHAREDEAVKMQVVRVRGDNFKVVGLLVPNHCVAELMAALNKNPDESMPVEEDN